MLRMIVIPVVKYINQNGLTRLVNYRPTYNRQLPPLRPYQPGYQPRCDGECGNCNGSCLAK